MRHDFRLSKPIHILIYQSRKRHARPRIEKDDPCNGSRCRRGGRPRATAAQDLFRSSDRTVSLQRRPGEAISAQIELAYGVPHPRRGLFSNYRISLLRSIPVWHLRSRIPAAALPEPDSQGAGGNHRADGCGARHRARSGAAIDPTAARARAAVTAARSIRPMKRFMLQC